MQYRSSPGLAPQHPSPHTADKAQRVYKDFVDENNQHVRVVANDPYVCTSTPEVTPQHRAQNPCKHFLQGHCNRGTACRFYHPDEPLTVTLRMGTPRRSPPLGPKTSSPGGVTDDGPEPPVMILPPSATAAAVTTTTTLTPRTNDPYKHSPLQRFSGQVDGNNGTGSKSTVLVSADFILPPAVVIPRAESPAHVAALFPTVRLPMAPPPTVVLPFAPVIGSGARDTTPIYTDDMVPRSDLDSRRQEDEDDA